MRVCDWNRRYADGEASQGIPHLEQAYISRKNPQRSSLTTPLEQLLELPSWAQRLRRIVTDTGKSMRRYVSMAPCGPLHLPKSARYRASSGSQLHASILSAILSSPQAWRNRQRISSWVTQRLLAVSCSCWTLVDACCRQDVPLNLPLSSNTVSEISELVGPCLGSQSRPRALKSEKPW